MVTETESRLYEINWQYRKISRELKDLTITNIFIFHMRMTRCEKEEFK